MERNRCCLSEKGQALSISSSYTACSNEYTPWIKAVFLCYVYWSKPYINLKINIPPLMHISLLAYVTDSLQENWLFCSEIATLWQTLSNGNPTTTLIKNEKLHIKRFGSYTLVNALSSAKQPTMNHQWEYNRGLWTT